MTTPPPRSDYRLPITTLAAALGQERFEITVAGLAAAAGAGQALQIRHAPRALPPDRLEQTGPADAHAVADQLVVAAGPTGIAAVAQSRQRNTSAGGSFW